MIGSFENKLFKTGYPGKNVTDLNKIDTLILSISDFVFDTETLFETQSQWIDDIKNEHLAVLKDMQEVDPDHEQTVYNKSRLDYEYRTKKGKYRYVFRTVYEPEYHEYIKSLSGQDLRVFLADVNNNIAANLSGANVHGLDVELIEVETKKLIGSTDPSWTVIRLVLSDPDEYNLTTKMTWNVNSFNLVHVSLTDITGSGNYVDFTIKDSVFGIPIDNLYEADLSISDDAGGITISSLTETGCGQYRIIASGSLTVGDIIVNSDRFYGSGEYVISQQTVIFNNFTYESDNIFQVDVRLSGDLSLYSGLEQADFTLLDDTNGPVVISSVTEVSTGRYEIETTTDLTTGDIDVDDGTVTGSGEYAVSIAIEAVDFGGLDGEPSSQWMEFDVRNVSTLAAITGLTQSAFTITDDLHGALTINSFSEIATGTYRVQFLNAPKTTGTVSISEGIYSGSGTYSYSTVFLNTGGPDTTDWINPDANGVPEYISVTSPTGNTITTPTESGFTGTVLKVQNTIIGTPVNINILANTFKLGVDYKLQFRYQTEGSGTGNDRFVDIYLYHGGSIPINGDSVEYVNNPSGWYESSVLNFSSTESQASFLQLQFAFSKYNMSFFVDEIELIEV